MRINLSVVGKVVIYYMGQIINIKTTERNGNVVAIRAVKDEDELMLITQKGMTLRTDLSAVREIGRATQGVRLIRIDPDDRLVAVARLARESDEADADADAEPETDEATDADGANDTRES